MLGRKRPRKEDREPSLLKEETIGDVTSSPCVAKGNDGNDDTCWQTKLVLDQAICSSTTCHEAPQSAATLPSSSLFDELDSEKIVVTLVLFVVIFFFFEPRGSVRASLRRRWRRYQTNRTAAAGEEPHQQPPPPPPQHEQPTAGLLTPDRDYAAPMSVMTTDAVFRHRHDGKDNDASSDTVRGDLPPLLRNVASAPTSPFISGTGALNQPSLELLPLLPPTRIGSFGEVQGRQETEEELFAQLWPAIRESPYRRLVLPPACKRVDRPTSTTATSNKQDSVNYKKRESRQKDEDVEEDHPLRRLQSYARQIGYFLRSLLSYDYASAVWWLVHWFQTLIRLRQGRRNSEGQEEDEDDDMSLATHASSVATARVGTRSPLRSPTTADATNPGTTPTAARQHHEHLELTPDSLGGDEEEKKDRDYDLNTSVLSYHSLPPSDDVSESDMSESTPAAPPPPLPPLPSRGKRKDALQSYRESVTGKNTLSPRMAPLSHPPTIASSHPTHLASFDELGPPSIESPDSPERKNSGDMTFFDAAHSRASLKRMSLDVPVPDRNGYILGDDFLRSSHTPLLVFVNSRSGPQQGQLLITQLRRLINPIQVWDLADGGPEKVLESFCVMSRLRILVCGGDGTVSWIISALEKMALERYPPMAILPLGTGNDLARLHGWGGGYNNESLIAILEQVADSYISLLDRWEMTVENRKGKVKEMKSFINYLGVGVDAQAALQVHMLRESTPKLFFSRAVNKAWYAIFGAEDAIKASHANLPHEITLIADGVEVPLPPDSQGIILLNIDSYAGGIPMWSHGTTAGSVLDTRRNSDFQDAQLRRTLSLDSMHNSSLAKSLNFDRNESTDDLLGFEKSFTDEEKLSRVTACNMPSSCQDGMLDIVSIRGTFHLGQIRVGLSNAQKLCQCREATIVIRKKTAVQIDGEPWRQTVSTLHVKRKKEQVVMLHRSADESGGVETEFSNLLDWAMERDIIDRNVHASLMREFSRRIETKTRQRRVRSQDNFMLTLKRAITNSEGPYR